MEHKRIVWEGRKRRSPNRHLLTLAGDDSPGLGASVTRSLAENGGNIDESQQFNDAESRRFFMRVVCSLAESADPGRLRAAFAYFAEANALTWTLRAATARRKVMLMVSKFDHCLGVLL